MIFSGHDYGLECVLKTILLTSVKLICIQINKVCGKSVHVDVFILCGEIVCYHTLLTEECDRLVVTLYLTYFSAIK